MICKVGLWGASGRMGQELAFLLRDGYVIDKDQLELVDAVSHSGTLGSVEGVDVRRPSEPGREPLHVWIDFSTPQGTIALLKEAKGPVVIGTTGLSDEEKETVVVYAQTYPVCLAPNLSPGMAWLRKCLNLGVPSGFEVVLEETHHGKKVDSPSGSAHSLSAILKAKSGRSPQTFSVRAGGVPGDHVVRFVGEDEELRFEHRVWNRSVFAKGALMAALSLVKKKVPGLFSLDDLV